MRAVFFSDVHLLRDDERRTVLFLDFCRDILEKVDHVYILGDLFEFYHGFDGHIYPWYQSVADELKRLTGLGKRIDLIEGNHEFGMGSFFETYTNVSCSREPLSVQIDGRKCYLAHGDSSDRFCLGRILKSSFVYRTMDLLGPSLTWYGAKLASLVISRKEKPYNLKIKDIFRGYSLKILGEGYDVVIFAHSHITDRVDLQTATGTKLYLNCGDLGDHCDYISYTTDAGFALERYQHHLS